MRILYCAPTDAGPLCDELVSYLRLACRALQEAGHSVFLLTWTTNDGRSLSPVDFLPSAHVRFVRIDPGEVTRRFSGGPWKTALSHILLPAIEGAVDEWNVDVVETTDHELPAYAFFQRARTSEKYRRTVLATFSHGLNLRGYRERFCFPDKQASDDLCSQRQMLRLSDIILCSDALTAKSAAGVGSPGSVELIAKPFEFTVRHASHAFSGRLVCRDTLGLTNAIDRLAYFVNQAADAIGASELYLIGPDAETEFRSRSAFDLLVRRLRPREAMRLVQTGDLADTDISDLMDASDLLCAFSTGDFEPYRLLTALDLGLVPFAAVGTPAAMCFPPELSHYLLPDDFSAQKRVAAVARACVDNKRAITEALQGYNQQRCALSTFARAVERHYGTVIDRKSARDAAPLQKAAPSVSVLIAAYNPGEEFGATLECLVRQTERPAEILICDDGSTTDLGPWINYARDKGLAVKCIRQRNMGLSGARNTLVDAAGGDLSLFLDCDDVLTDDALSRLVSAWVAAGSPDAVIPTRTNFGESNETVLRHLLNDHLHLIRNEYRMTALIRTSVLRDIRFDAMRRNGEADDWLFWLEFSARKFRAEFIPDAVFLYRFYTGSMSWPWASGQAAATADMIGEIARRFARSSWSDDFLDSAAFEIHAAIAQLGR